MRAPIFFFKLNWNNGDWVNIPMGNSETQENRKETVHAFVPVTWSIRISHRHCYLIIILPITIKYSVLNWYMRDVL